ncbi:Serine-arginine protein 55 [Halotydeus destructor]|nr:Serine-arginine protein 55 [Halotydeus destructor]
MGTRVYVGRLPYDVRERDVEKFFKGYGRVREVLMKDGFAFVEFDDHRDADDAVYELNGKELLGERVHVEFARGPARGRDRGDRGYSSRDGDRGGRGGRFGGGDRGSRGHNSSGGSGRDRGSGMSYSEKYGPPRNTEYRVIVENLSSRVSWQDLKDFMRTAGEVTYADAHKRERNMGIVDFASEKDMKTALDKLDGADLHGRRIKLGEDKSRRGRKGSRSRSRSRSPRSSKSRSRSASRSRSPRSKSKSRSRSPRKNTKNNRSRSRSADNAKNGSRSPSRSRSPADRNRSKSRSPRVERSRSRSKSPANVRNERSRSRSPSVANDRRRSRSRSASPGAANGNEED